ncbi:ribosome small subunit-dependent GTPase A [Mangrovibacillus cuniculi]|uniref:Small ribosomal subunit biogenesis GTPase RsgA n=1 Tax=Mangrovibacillus cuniculi TaxID=2593652 RepID=A0A7S8CAJ1_9BACI|nr:ribosome small subunit-dependent GTPase A [Mangrovibacillus cuniculi]QPC46301.1 ribosome small subunit-dependent GTPase A [Mangrovibacillus cuniculi]
MPKGQIMKALSGFYYVKMEDRLIQCRGRGVFRNKNISPLVGDYVHYEFERDQEGTIMEVFDRKNELVRPPIANVDQAILVFSCVEPEFNPGLLDRFLVLIEYHDIEPIICLTKIDLVPKAKLPELESFIEDYRKIGYQVVITSSETAEGLENLLPLLKDKLSVFAGQSGVGKSSLLNALRPDLELKTAGISTHLGRGKHTTRHVELMDVNGGAVADTPGFSSLELMEMEVNDVTFCMPEFQRASEKCKFRGCLHINEPKCAVKTGVEEGTIPAYRYDHYLQFIQEIQDRKPRY